ncbi:PAS domain S-box protein [Haloferax sp. MBLA0076]|uniref:PAS domain S-box protein n=1 Tax=Haloferax litoreum TaxID=2666140 RepID=A0A6A8GN02_9EURY|nr:MULTISPECIES: PAS domain S-box protein [Haloferax]KAB1189974.1 PAS domain S-box protein [Haloferax sp. CBA1148]MRX23747.1 PAS domain S-box protein [Haloferax litoreum]
MADWIREETPHTPVVEGDEGYPTGDLCIVDAEMVTEHWEWLQSKKECSHRVFFPILFVHSGESQRITDSVWNVVDEAISTPIRLPVFERRLKNLLQRRMLSENLHRELAVTKDKYRAVFDASNDAIVVIDPERDTIDDSNRQASELLGYSRAELAALSPRNRLFSSDSDSFDRFVDSVLGTGEGWTDELIVTKRSGDTIVAEVSASVLEMDDDSGRTRLVASIRDITERQQQQRELEHQRDQLDELHRINRTLRKTTQVVARASSRHELEREVCEQLARSDRYEFAWIGTVDEATKDIVPRQTAGPAGEYLESVTIRADDSPTGRGPAGTAVRECSVSIVQEIQSDPQFEPWRDRAATFGVHAVAGVPIHYDGEVYGVLAIYANLPNAFDRVEQAVLADLGVTIGHAINALQAHTEVKLFEEAVEQAGHAIYIANGNGIIEYVNSAFEESTGYTRDEVIGRHHSLLRVGEDEQAFPPDLWETIWAGETWQDETTGRRKDGRRQHVDQTVAPISGTGSSEEYFVAVRIDITDQRRRRQQLQTLHRIFRHNIRNELNVIQGYLDIIDEVTPPETAESPMSKIRASTEELLQISTQARRIERTFVGEDDGNTVNKRSFAEILIRQCSSARMQFGEATVEMTVPEVGNAMVDAEFETALEEILTNALRHNDSETPRAVCEVTVEETTHDVTQAVVSVRDNGPGIPEHERRVLSEGEETPLLHGSGLGLWLVNWIIKEIGGEIRIDDIDPRSTIVTLRLPLYRP